MTDLTSQLGSEAVRPRGRRATGRKAAKVQPKLQPESAPTRARRPRTGAGARINADHVAVYWAINTGVVATVLVGIVASWDGLIHVSEWGVFPAGAGVLLPILIDLPISVLALASLALKSRGRPGISAVMLGLSILFTSFAGVANFIYVADSVGLDNYRDYTAAIFKALAPAIQLVMVEVLGVLVAKPPAMERTKLAAAREQLKAVLKENKSLRAAARRATGAVES
jgi:uncharacterized membrane protein